METIGFIVVVEEMLLDWVLAQVEFCDLSVKLRLELLSHGMNLANLSVEILTHVNLEIGTV